jgi:hypothetical protein
MKLSRCLLLLLPALLPAAGAKPLPETTVAQAAARIDRLLEDDLQLKKLTPTPLIDDATFVRRAYLGIVGRIPSAEEARAFLDDKSPTKRAALVDQLVASPGFDSHLFNWTADLLRVQTRQEQFGLGWHVWLRQSLAEDKPWNSLVTEMLTSTGHCVNDPAVGYYLRDRNMQLDNFSNTMQVFLGRQIGCAQCHDHPFDDWSQFEYYQMAAFGGGIEYRSEEAQEMVRKTVKALSNNKPAKQPAATFAPKPGNKNNKNNKANKANKARQLENQKRSEQQRLTRTIGNQLRPLFKDFNKNAILEEPGSLLKLPEDYQYRDGKPGEVIEPETLFGTKVSNVAPEERRDTFAAWLTAPENPYFTKVIANRLWDRAFGHGLVDPLDDWKDDSTTAHPEVLAYLETTMKGANYDLRQFLRILYRTRLFQRACLDEEPEMGVPLAFRGPVLTRMSAEQLHDSFLVLFHGEVEDSSNTFARNWDAYRSQVNHLLETEPKQLLVLGKSAQEGEKIFRAAQTELRAAQRALANADSGDARGKAQREVQEARRTANEARRQYDPLLGMQMGKKAGGKNGNDTLRASEQPAPFNPGSLVREFGGSDRQTPSSGHTEATVPQALALLNNNRTDPLSGRKTRLGQALERCESPEEKLDLLFLTLFSQPPDADDKQRFLVHAKDPAALRDLTRAMLTSSRFLFIQ